MLSSPKYWFIPWLAMTIAGLRCAGAAEIPTLPVAGSNDHPALLLELGSAPPSLAAPAAGIRVEGSVPFRGLASEATRQYYQGLQVKYLIGAEAEAMVRGMNLPSLPSALISDDNYSLLGILAAHGNETEAEVTRFLAEPELYGKLPALADEPLRPLRDGVPEAWLVGGLQDGVAGVSIYGLDTETVLRPNPGQPYFATEMTGGRMRTWQKAPTDPQGQTVIEESTKHDYRWSKGTGYGQLYLHVGQATRARLRLDHSGIASDGWLDGQPMALSGYAAELNITPGWHSLLLKFVMEHDRGQRFTFGARFTDGDGKPLNTIHTRTTDPVADAALNRVAGKLRPLIYVEAPANLPRPGDPLKIRADLRWHPLMEEKELPAPLPRFRARLCLQLKDYRGRNIAERETEALFPGVATLDFGKAPETGYYAVYPSLHTPAGRAIIAYPADGFSVVRSNATQKARLDKKKLWNNDYYAFADGDRGFHQDGGYFAWLERMGIFRSYGSYPGFEPKHRPLWDEARRRGLELFADTAGDSHWLNDAEENGRQYITAIAPYTRYFKASNEIDIRREVEWQKLRDPARWVRRARWEYGQVHQARPDGHYVGGSLVRPGDLGGNAGYPGGLGPGRWFEEVLKLGLDRYLDAWDVHAYPQHPPRFGGPIGNADTEGERGVMVAYARLGRRNTLPFWLGEAGAKAAHGHNGRRWQAAQAAKMIAWVNSRADYLGLAFCIAHEYDFAYGRLWDYSMGHKPGEAALYTAGALIDGLPYKAVESGDANIQSAYFGETLMVWRTDEKTGEWRLALDPKQAWVLVDVVGHAEGLPVPADGNARVTLTENPIYVLSRAEYRRLTGD